MTQFYTRPWGYNDEPKTDMVSYPINMQLIGELDINRHYVHY